MSDPLATLADRLGVSRDRLDGLAGCAPADLADLEGLVAAAFATEDEEVEAGLRRTVSAVPRPLRGKAKALLFPRGRHVNDLLTRVEVEKLAHDLSVDAGRLEFLAALPAETVRTLRADLAEALFARHEARFRGLAKLSHLAPMPIVAKVAEVAFSPLLGARVAAVMEPEHAVRLARRLNVPFLTDLSVRLDPARAEPIIRGLPAGLVTDIGRRLVERKEYVALGRFVSVVDADAALAVVVDATAEDLLRVALFTEDAAALDVVIGGLSDQRLNEVLELGLGSERDDQLATLLQAVGPETRERLVGLLGDLGTQPLLDRL